MTGQGAAGRKPFLRARWQQLAMLNFEVEPAALASWIPRGTELDTWNGSSYLSVVGFLFLETRVAGISVPFHRDFEEVNLRFYVRRKADDGWRRGVVFVKEMVPRAAIALVARWLYAENYVAVPMDHRIERSADGSRVASATYGWTLSGRRQHLRIAIADPPQPLTPGSHAEFIAEHYWGYSAQRDGGTCEYRVEHPPWRIAPAAEAALDCDVEGVYGRALARYLKAEPVSAFLADGSEVTVSYGGRLPV